MGEVIPFRKKQESEKPEIIARKLIADIGRFRAEVSERLRTMPVANIKHEDFFTANEVLNMFEESAHEWSYTVDKEKGTAVIKGLYDEYMEAKQKLRVTLGI